MQQARLKTKIGCPYGGLFQLNLPAKGLVGRGTSFEHIRDNIRDWRKANAVPIGLGFEEELERELCYKYPAECEQTNPLVPPANIRITMDDLVAATKNLGSLKLAGTPLVSIEEANRRALICSQCPFQSDFSRPCGGICQSLKDAVQLVIGNQKTKYDDSLRACRVCKCFNAATVWVPLEYQTKYLTDLQREQFAFAKTQFGCWKNP